MIGELCESCIIITNDLYIINISFGTIFITKLRNACSEEVVFRSGALLLIFYVRVSTKWSENAL